MCTPTKPVVQAFILEAIFLLSAGVLIQIPGFMDKFKSLVVNCLCLNILKRGFACKRIFRFKQTALELH